MLRKSGRKFESQIADISGGIGKFGFSMTMALSNGNNSSVRRNVRD
jgi:hypothetical protein